MEQYRELFASFQNLNLLTLINNLEDSRICAREWVSKSYNNYMCPVQHGAPNSHWMVTELVEPSISGRGYWGEDSCLRLNFWTNWDRKDIGREELVRLLRDIYAERLEDADAVQGVICEDNVPVVAI